MNAFIAFVKANKDRIKDDHGKNLSIAGVTSKASLEWKVLTPEQKAPFLEQYEK